MNTPPLLIDDARQAGVQTFVDVLEFRARKQPADRVFRFLRTEPGHPPEITYRELQRQAQAIAANLSEVAVAGDRVVLLIPPGLEYIAAFMGCLYAGVVAVPAYPPNPRRADSRVARIVEDSEARIALVSHSLMLRLEHWLSLMPGLPPLAWLDVERLANDSASAWRAPDITSSTLAMLQYTSGSTGEPRGVMLSHANLLHNSAVIHRVTQIREGDSVVMWLPPFHDMGLIGGILQPIYANFPQTLLTPAAFLQRPVRWLEAISQYRATTSGAPNFAYDLCVERITESECQGLDLSSWRTTYNGAEPIRAETIARFTSRFAPYGLRADVMMPCYGLAENTLMVCGGPANEPPFAVNADRAQLELGELQLVSDAGLPSVALVASGIPTADVKVAIVDPDSGQRVGQDQIGEIWIAGQSVAAGYWNRPDESATTFGAHLPDSNERYLRTGDLGVMHDGRLLVTGRLKDLIILQGRNHYPHDIEVIAQHSHANVRTGLSAAFSVSDRRRERLILLAEVSRQHRSAADSAVFLAIRTEMAARIGVVPDEILLLRHLSIPRTSSGKVQRRSCRLAFLEGALDVVAHWKLPVPETPPASEALLAFVVDWLRADLALDAASIGPDTSLRDLALDSLAMARLTVAIEEHTGQRLDSGELWAQPHLRSLVAMLLERDARAGVSTVTRNTSTYQLDAESTDIGLWPEFRDLRQRLDHLSAQGVENPFFRIHDGPSGSRAVLQGKTFINFSNYNYLGLSGHPHVTKAANGAVAQWGTSVSASRIVAGERSIHRDLEAAVAGFVGVPDALVFVAGHATNVSTISHLLGKEDVVLCDALLHNSAMLGADFSGARRLIFPHNDWRALDGMLERVRNRHRRALVIIEGIYSADGDIPDLKQFVEVKSRHHAMLMVDEAHSIGVLGPTGRGLSEHSGVSPNAVDIWMGTLSKSFASCGGYIAGNHALVEYLRYTAPGFVYSVGMPPANAAAALAALQVLIQEPERLAQLRTRVSGFFALCRDAGIDAGPEHGTPIVPVRVGTSLRALKLAQHLHHQGISVQPMIAPAVPENEARLRFFLSSTHTDRDLHCAVQALSLALREIPQSPEGVGTPEPHAAHTAGRGNTL